MKSINNRVFKVNVKNKKISLKNQAYTNEEVMGMLSYLRDGFQGFEIGAILPKKNFNNISINYSSAIKLGSEKLKNTYPKQKGKMSTKATPAQRRRLNLFK